MPIAKVQLPDGKIGRFEVPEGTTEAQVLEFAKGMATGSKDYQFGAGVGPDDLQNLQPLNQDGGSTIVRPVLEGLGAASGAIVGTAAGPLGSVAGGGLGYGMGAQAADLYEQATGQAQPPKGFGEAAQRAVGNVAEGAMMEMGGQALGPALRGAKNLVATGGREVLGMATGAGPEAIRQAAKGSPLFKKAMSGGIGSDDILDQAKSALQTVKQRRGDEISVALEGMAVNKTQLPQAPIKQKASNWMRKFNIRRTAEGGYDFSRSTINKNAEGDASEIIDMMDSWGSETPDFTPSGLHRLKIKLDDFYSESKNVKAMVQDLRTGVKSQIVKEVPEYAAMMKDYEKATRFINDAQKGLSLTDKVGLDTTLKKLLSTNRENFEFRKEILQQLEQSAEVELAPQLAGLSMQQFLPKGLIGKAVGGGAIAAGAGLTPGVMAVAAMSSPRLAGEFLHSVVGIPRQQAKRLVMSRKFQKLKGVLSAAGKAAPRTAIAETQE